MAKGPLVPFTILSALALQVSAQLLSCLDVNCPKDLGSFNCEIENKRVPEVGVANFSSSLSPDPLTWTVGYGMGSTADAPDERRYFLGTPPGLSLDSRTDTTGCALFFTGVEASLSFGTPSGTALSEGQMSGTCADALGSSCESDLTKQAHDLLSNSTELQCTDVARTLESSPPSSCAIGSTWGNITVKAITGSDVPASIKLDDCKPTINATYDMREIATFPMAGSQPIAIYVTPLMTIFKSSDNGAAASEIHLNCMKPIEAAPTGNVVQTGGAKAVSVRSSVLAISISVIEVFAAVVLMV